MFPIIAFAIPLPDSPAGNRLIAGDFTVYGMPNAGVSLVSAEDDLSPEHATMHKEPALYPMTYPQDASENPLRRVG